MTKTPTTKTEALAQAMQLIKATAHLAPASIRGELEGKPLLMIIGNCLRVYYTADDGTLVQVTMDIWESNLTVRTEDRNVFTEMKGAK